jgi:hypothetical protein
MKSFFEDMLSSEDTKDFNNFDSFFVGEGSKSLLNKKRQYDFRQLLDNFNVFSSENNLLVDEDEILMEEDLSDFSKKSDKVVSYCDLYFKSKKEAYDIFDFIKIKSKRNFGKPLREKDLILQLDDYNLVDYLEKNKYDLGIVCNLARLKAFFDMGFLEVKFYSSDCCSLCSSNNFNVYKTEGLILSLSNNNFFMHGESSGIFFPVIRNRSAFNVFDGEINKKRFVNRNNVSFFNVPNELFFVFNDLLNSFSYNSIEKVFFVNFCEDRFFDFSNFVRERGDSLYIHNGYVDLYGPIDFLFSWLSTLELDICNFIKNSDNFYYFNGRKVINFDGVYYDLDHNEFIK